MKRTYKGTFTSKFERRKQQNDNGSTFLVYFHSLSLSLSLTLRHHQILSTDITKSYYFAVTTDLRYFNERTSRHEERQL